MSEEFHLLVPSGTSSVARASVHSSSKSCFQPPGSRKTDKGCESSGRTVLGSRALKKNQNNKIRWKLDHTVLIQLCPTQALCTCVSNSLLRDSASIVLQGIIHQRGGRIQLQQKLALRVHVMEYRSGREHMQVISRTRIHILTDRAGPRQGDSSKQNLNYILKERSYTLCVQREVARSLNVLHAWLVRADHSRIHGPAIELHGCLLQRPDS